MTQIVLLEEHAREVLAMGAGWYGHTFHAERNPADLQQLMYYRVDGCMTPLLSKGSRKGKPNFRKPIKGTERTVYFTPQQQDAWEIAWAERTGKCRTCVGEGTELVRWSATEGSTYRPCHACHGGAPQ